MRTSPNMCYLQPDDMYDKFICLPHELHRRRTVYERSGTTGHSLMPDKLESATIFDFPSCCKRTRSDENLCNLRYVALKVATWVARRGMLDAFRIASRMEAFCNPISRNCLRHILEYVESLPRCGQTCASAAADCAVGMVSCGGFVHSCMSRIHLKAVMKVHETKRRMRL